MAVLILGKVVAVSNRKINERLYHGPLTDTSNYDLRVP